MRERALALVLSFAVVMNVAWPRTAEACGCLSPPAVTDGEFAVNQRAEQIIFEVEPGWVTAHVLIKYAGAPASFAWIVPVPEVPELGLSPVSAFGLIDQATAPIVNTIVEDICPKSEWACRYHPSISCPSLFGGDDDGVFTADAGSWGGADAGGAGEPPPPVTVIDEQVIGDYQTVTFRASEAQAATQWLRSNGFIVNPTTSIYMESYVQANMVFVAIKLVAGAGIDAIKPLKMRYRAAFPMVPLVLTAVAAEPHLTVTSYVYGDAPFRPMGHPVATIDEERIARGDKGRLNYPMVLARTIDEAGGDAFAVEYLGAPPRPQFGNAQCCSSGYDFCSIGDNQTCECPGAEFDRADCESRGDLLEGIDLVNELATKHTTMTRLTTRVSPEEMRFDPQFESEIGAPLTGRLTLTGRQPSLQACDEAVIDKPRYAEVETMQGCAAMYCGIGGQCVTTPNGAGCVCGVGTVAQRFTDLDGEPSVTCVPETPTCDLRAGGDQLPDACAGQTCGAGRCIDRNGIAVCDCEAGNAAVVAGLMPRCEPIQKASMTPGATDFSDQLRGMGVCAPKYPSCGESGWLEWVGSERPGVDCGNATPPTELTTPKDKPTCGNGFFGCGCQAPDAPAGGIAVLWLGVGFLVMRRRRSAR